DACGLEGLPHHGRRHYRQRQPQYRRGRGAASGGRRPAISCIVVAQCGRWRHAEGGLAMNYFGTIGAVITAWTTSVAAAIVAGLDRLVSPRVVRLVEDDAGQFAVARAVRADNAPARV